MKDLFIDNNFAVKYFKNPSKDIINFIDWLIDREQLTEKAHLVISKKLLNEYFSSNQDNKSYASIITIIEKMISSGRVIEITNDQIKNFQQQFFTPKVKKELQSNRKDWNHIPLVLTSCRKIALTLDKKFKIDLLSFPGFKGVIVLEAVSQEIY